MSAIAMPLAFTGFSNPEGTAEAASTVQSTNESNFVYSAGVDNEVHKTNADTGENDWIYTGHTDDVNGISANSDDGIYTGDSAGEVHKIDPDTGDQQWTYTGHSNTVWTITADNSGNVYSGSWGGQVHKIDAETGEQEWAYTNTAGDVYAISTDGDAIYAATETEVHKIDADTGEQLWSNTADLGGQAESLTVGSDALYVGTAGNEVHRINFDTGSETWLYTGLPNTVSGVSSDGDGGVYATGTNAALHKISADSGDRLWENTDGTTSYSLAVDESGNLYAVSSSSVRKIDTETGSQDWSYGGHSNTVKSVGTNFLAGLSGEPVTGVVRDQHGDPVENATVLTHSINEPALDESDVRSLERQAKDLQQELTNPLPDSFSRDLNVEGDFLEGKSEEVPLAYTSEDIATAPWTDDADLVPPKVVLPADESVNFVPWNPDGDQGRLPDGYELQLPGTHIEKGPIVVEQLGPGGDVTDTTTVPVDKQAGGGWGDPSSMPYAETQLPAGVYQIHIEGDDAKYPIVVGSPSELASAWESDLRDQKDQLTQRANRIRDLLAQEHISRSTVRTDENGSFTAEVPSNAVTTDVKALKADGELLQTLENPQNASLEDLREFQANDYNGSFYLPSPTPTTVEPPAENVSVTVYRSPDVPLSDIESFADLQSWLEDQRLNETVDELRSEYNQRFEEMERSSLERIYKDHRTLTETVPGAEDRYLERSEFNETRNASNLSSEELPRETNHMQVALAGIGEIEPPDLSGESPIDVGDGGINFEYPLPGSVDPDSVAPEIHWSDGTAETIGEDYYEIDSGMFGAQTLTITDLPIEDSDPAAFDIRVRGASTGDSLLPGVGDDTEGLLDDRVSGLNPAAAGTAPGIDAVDFSTLAPGPSERVHVGISPTAETGYDSLVSASAWADDGTELNTTIDTDRDRASFRTDGQGTHTVRLTYANQQGDQFVVSERIDAKQQSRSDPATVRASGSPNAMTGVYAVTGENLDGARLESNGGTLDVTVVADDSDGPGELVLKPSNAMGGTTHTIDVEVVHGSGEASVQSNIPVNIHLTNPRSQALYWRSEAGFGGSPITHAGDTRHGSVDTPSEGKHVVRTYTESDGSLTVTIVESAGYIDRASHQVSQWIGNVPLVGSIIPIDFAIPSGEFVGLLGLAGIAAHRRRYAQ